MLTLFINFICKTFLINLISGTILNFSNVIILELLLKVGLVMQISPVNNLSPLNFKGKSKEKDPTLPLAAIPGVHQLLNGRTKEGLLFVAGDAAIVTFAYLLDKSVKKDAAKAIVSVAKKDTLKREELIKSLKVKKNGYFLVVPALIVLEIVNWIDVYKHPRKK